MKTLLPFERPIEYLVEAMWPIWFRGKGRLFNHLIQHSGQRDAVIFGSHMKLDMHDYIQRNMYLGTYEPMETAVIGKYLKPGMTFLDIGANVGYYTALAAKKVGASGRVIAIEPSSYAFEILKRLVNENNLNYVIPLRIAASSSNGEMPLYWFPECDGNHAPTLLKHKDGVPTMVPVKTIDSCLDELKIDKVDLIKMDIQGHELEATKGMIRALKAKRIRALAVEFCGILLREAGTTPEELKDFIESFGYKIDRPLNPSPTSLTTQFFEALD